MPESGLATKEQESQRCQVCDFPTLAGRVEGEIEGERYSLRICQSCLQHAVLCLRDSYRQNRLFDDDFEIAELCGFGKVSPGLKGEAADWEQMKPVGREWGSDEDDAQQAQDILERVNRGEEQVFSAEEVRKDLGLDKDE